MWTSDARPRTRPAANVSLRRRILLTSLLAIGLLSVGAGSVSAHFEDQAYLYLDVAPDDLQGNVQLPAAALREVFGLELEGPDEVILAELRSNLPELQAYIQAHTRVGDADAPWTLDFAGVELLGESGFIVFPFAASVPDGLVPRQFDVRFDALLDEIDGRTTLVLLRNDWQGGIYDEEANTLVVLDRDARESTIDLGSASQWKNFTASIPLGIDHIRTGLDHVAFVLALLLPAVLVGSLAWRPAPSFGGAFWRILKIATMFTLAHSITFTLAGLDLLPLPSPRIVESVIALSIAVAALHNLRPVLVDREWLIAFVFGLFHGMGFASLVNSIDIDRPTRLYSLIGRNIGIEIGQAVVIVLVFPALYLLRRTRYYRPILVTGSLMLFAISVVWVTERVFEVDLRTALIGARFAARSSAEVIAAALLATIVAAWLYRIEHRAGRLVDISDPPSTDSPTAEIPPVDALVN